MKKVGFIGIGVMGHFMVKNLLKNGYEVFVYNRTKSKADEVVKEGALWCDDIKTCVSGKDFVVTIVGYPKDVKEVYFGENGILDSADKGSVLIDMTTTSPKLAVEIYEEAKARGIYAIDAPVSGGDVGAKNGTLSIMAGGDKEIFDKCYDVFKCMGTTIIYEGKAGNGQHTKMANQIAIAGAVSGVCEAITYAKAVGLDVQTMLNSISEGAAGNWQMSNMAPRMIKGDFGPGFYIKHFIKDMKIAKEEAEDENIDLKVLDTVLKMYETLEENNMGELGTQGIIKYYEK